MKPEVRDEIQQLYECSWLKSSDQEPQNLIFILFTHLSAIYNYEFQGVLRLVLLSFITNIIITILMPQRTSKILLVRLTATKNALLFQIRVTCLARYTVWFGVTRSDQNAVKDYFTLSTITSFDWFPLHTRMEASFRVILIHGVYQNFLLVSTFLSNYAQ